MRVAILGAGTMANHLVGSILRGEAGPVDVVGIASSAHSETQAADLANRLGCVAAMTVGDLAERRPDLLVEVASQQAVRDHAVAFLDRGIDILLMSVGSLLEPTLYEQMTVAARRTGRRVYLPSGAIGGLDALRSARMAGLQSVTLTTSKPPLALRGAPFFQDHPVDLGAITARTTVFEGSASEAVQLFPSNINVAALVSLAGIGPQDTTVRIVADPALQRNVHEIQATGTFGDLHVQLSNVASLTNPKTSQLAGQSLVAALRRLSEPIQVG